METPSGAQPPSFGSDPGCVSPGSSLLPLSILVCLRFGDEGVLSSLPPVPPRLSFLPMLQASKSNAIWKHTRCSAALVPVLFPLAFLSQLVVSHVGSSPSSGGYRHVGYARVSLLPFNVRQCAEPSLCFPVNWTPSASFRTWTWRPSLSVLQPHSVPLWMCSFI